jgi:signal transduction histidine kinase
VRQYGVGMKRPGGPRGRRLAPVEAFEVTPWRSLALFRIASLVWAGALIVHNHRAYAYPVAGLLVFALMAIWSALAIAGYERAALRAWPLLLLDLSVTAGFGLASRWVIGAEPLARGLPTLTIIWMACPVMAVAVVRGIRPGVLAALLIGGCDLFVRGGITQATVTGTAIMVTAALALGYLADIAIRAQERMRMLAAADAAYAERERIARGIHDSVLQVLALVQRRGEAIGGEAAELGRLAGEQEAALRALIASGGPPTADGEVDLRATLGGLAAANLSIALPPTPVWLPAQRAGELTAAVAAALENVQRHCPPGTPAWLLLEDEGGAITVTVRDDGPGIPPGRLEQAAAQGRLGVAQSIRGRLRALGGKATITTSPGAGTEIEMRVTA